MKLYYKSRGEGTPFVILHGLYGMSDNWMSIIRKIDGPYKFILPDLRNHGKSGFNEDHSYDAMVEDLKDLLVDLGITKTILLGHSMGGKVAMRFALKYPQMIEKMVVVDIAPKNYSGFKNFGRLTTDHEEIIEKLCKHDISSVERREELDEMFSADLPNKMLRAFLLKNIERNKDGKFEWQINLPVLQKQITHILDGFGNVSGECFADTLFVKGEKSPYIMADDLFYIKKFFPNADLVTITNAGHWVHAEQPVQLIKTITFFLA